MTLKSVIVLLPFCFCSVFAGCTGVTTEDICQTYKSAYIVQYADYGLRNDFVSSVTSSGYYDNDYRECINIALETFETSLIEELSDFIEECPSEEKLMTNSRSSITEQAEDDWYSRYYVLNENLSYSTTFWENGSETFGNFHEKFFEFVDSKNNSKTFKDAYNKKDINCAKDNFEINQFCDDSCGKANDGSCDDYEHPNQIGSECYKGTDCSDCGTY